jgi:aminopeptidase N
VGTEHDGIPLGVHCRRSLAAYLDAEDILDITRRSFDRYHELFDERYPFGKYDQAFVPELNFGAVENPGCVTFRDEFLFRSAVTDTERETRAIVIAHEMAHMWFGDLVTMRWWDDLWLNESFAEYMGHYVVPEASRFTFPWTGFALKRKTWGYDADQRPSSHPVAARDIDDTTAALVTFDGISYAKGASALRQLVVWLGEEAFLAGVNAYFARHRFGNADLADLLDALALSGDRDVHGWAERWLRTSGVDTLRAELTDQEGRLVSAEVVQTGSPGVPGCLRPHRISAGAYSLVDGEGAVYL